MVERELTVNSQGTRLAATACSPKGAGRVASVLMIHGTGPLDRDENMKGQPLDTFNAIAQHLASVGIASFRYDKRGCGKSSGDYYRAGHSDLVADAVSCLDALLQLEFCDAGKVFVLGHSEGCIIAPQISAKRPVVAGLILLCPFVDSVEAILIKQATRIQREFDSLPGVLGQVRRLLSKMMGMTVSGQHKVIRRLKSSEASTIRVRCQKIPAKSLRELIDLRPAEMFRRVTCPVLLLGGGKDIQCDPADVSRIADLVNGPVSTHVVPNLTHVLRCDAGHPSFLSVGELLHKPVEPVVMELIAAWFGEQHGVGLNS